MAASAKSRAKRGAELLDQHVKGWAKKIDTDKLLIRSDLSCVLGQLFKGDCQKGLDKLGIGVEQAVAHGFMHEDCESYYSNTLDDRWKAEIYERAPQKIKTKAKLPVPAEQEPKAKKATKKKKAKAK